MAGGDHGVGAAVAHEVRADADRGVAFLPDRRQRGVVHLDDFLGVHDLDVRRHLRAELRADGILAPDQEGQLSFTGLVGSADGARVWLSDVSGSIKVFAVGSDGSVQPSHSIPLPPDKQLPRIKVLTVAPLLADAIKRIHFNESVSKLFE